GLEPLPAPGVPSGRGRDRYCAAQDDSGEFGNVPPELQVAGSTVRSDCELACALPPDPTSRQWTVHDAPEEPRSASQYLVPAVTAGPETMLTLFQARLTGAVIVPCASSVVGTSVPLSA